MHRSISYSEVETALTCFARWDFAYSDRLAGSSIFPKEIAPVLGDGRAWGAAVAAWHQGGGTHVAQFQAHDALNATFDQDAFDAESRVGPLDQAATRERRDALSAMLDHYCATATPLTNLTRLEEEIVVPLRSRSGRRASSKYRFQCFIDGYTVDEHGNRWLVEFKLRKQLQGAGLIQLAPQLRWYSWALREADGKAAPLGVLVDERLNAAPKPARVLKSGKPSHAKDQLCTPEAYVDACMEAGDRVNMETHEALKARRWQQRVPILFRDGELDEAGGELVTAGKLIHSLDSGVFSPVRNAAKTRCSGCRFREVCADPTDALLIDQLFDRKPAKRDREEQA